VEKNEKKIILMLAGAWDEFVKLKEQHPMHRSEFCAAIHRAQHIVMARFAERQHPELFPFGKKGAKHGKK
jgi:hypothetical protein